jgi:GNAT superfamily N-acetyltransferase
MKNSEYEIKVMQRRDLDTAVQWAADEGWNPGLYDADCFYQTDPNGFFMGFKNDQPISSISAVSYGADFGFIGFYIVKKEFRSKGYGLQIWNKAMQYLGSQNIGLDGVVAQQDNYKKSGFKLAYNNARYQFNSNRFSIEDPTIKSVEEVLIDELNEYDKRFFPVDRKQFLSCWVKQPESTTLVSLADNRIQGYGMIRKCRNGYKVGPLFADNLTVANNIFQKLSNRVEEKSPIFLDIPEVNQDAIELVNQHQMEKVFATARMYTKEAPKLPVNNIFGVTTFELG